jgi:hypothetical protein
LKEEGERMKEDEEKQQAELDHQRLREEEEAEKRREAEEEKLKQSELERQRLKETEEGEKRNGTVEINNYSQVFKKVIDFSVISIRQIIARTDTTYNCNISSHTVYLVTATILRIFNRVLIYYYYYY